MNFFKRQTRSSKIKNIYVLSCLLIISILVLFQYTQALFINKSKEVVTNIKVGDLRYELSSTSFNPNTTNITIAANQEKTVTINLTNLNHIDTKYELYYEPNVEGVETGFTKDSDLISDTITTDETKTINLYINNTTTNNITIVFKLNSGFGHNKLALKNIIIEEIELPDFVVDIVDNMIPVSWDGSTLIKADKTNTNNNWYDYDNQKWANAVLVTDESREIVKSANDGTTIVESDILAYYTYIPRYRYLLWNANNNINCLNDNCNEQEIMVEFENKTTTPKSSGSTNGEWLTHPAFTFGGSDLNGIWVGKFTTSIDPSTACYTSPSNANCNQKTRNPRIKPNADMWRYLDVSSMFAVTKKIETNSIYGLNYYDNTDSHMMKNMEWGAVAYLSYSKYGKYGNENYIGANKQLYINNYRVVAQAYKTETGCSSGTPNASQNQSSCPHPYPNLSLEALGASTTGNIYGIYDMSGGIYEYVMGNMVTDDSQLGTFYANSNSGTWDSIPELKYYDSYSYDTDFLTHGRGHLGDATKETLKTFGTLDAGGWYSDYSYFPDTTNVWFLRGGAAHTGANAGAFSFINGTGAPGHFHGFRVVLALE